MRTKRQLTKSILIYAAGMMAIALVLVNTGCGSTKVQSETNTSAGQQLMDLQKAHEQGLVNDKEYEKLRQGIIKKNK